ncbi:uncharacterized protein LOC100378301 [Saccoglossus kowalevskii]|uniref:Uncharacterized protein LOC100378301 n=1 Tax=Saccoglossus kowalevskii TaxID=10224 RepID=A0ABM0H1X9_SACKO|nr:PREDICTED: uncharacterized protein LOC100378301 [Saccoglossus kowalevskii]
MIAMSSKFVFRVLKIVFLFIAATIFLSNVLKRVQFDPSVRYLEDYKPRVKSSLKELPFAGDRGTNIMAPAIYPPQANNYTDDYDYDEMNRANPPINDVEEDMLEENKDDTDLLQMQITTTHKAVDKISYPPRSTLPAFLTKKKSEPVEIPRTEIKVKEPSKVVVPEEFPDYYNSTRDPKQMKYLIAVNFLQGGPNFHYENFKLGLLYALHHKRAIFALPFANHYGLREQRFWWGFGETFDMGVLNNMIPVVSPKRFQEVCGGKINLMLVHPFTERNQRSFEVYKKAFKLSRTFMKDIVNIDLPPWESTPKSVTTSREQFFEQAEDARCLVMYKPLDFWKNIKEEIEPGRRALLLSSIYKHLDRAPSVKEMADDILKNICDGKPFMSMHWRNRTGEICGRQLRNSDRLNCDKLLPYISSASKKVVGGVKQIMIQHGLSCIYIAHPSYSSEIVTYMKEKIPNVYTSQNILAMNTPAVARLRRENYLLSLVEQEIVYRGVVFIASLTTNWSEFVADQRTVNHRETLFLHQIPGVPKQLYTLI